MEEPFQQWGLYFIGEINLNASIQHKWNMTSKYYFTKWIEAIPIKEDTNKVIIYFLENNILSRFGYPRNIGTDNEKHF